MMRKPIVLLACLLSLLACGEATEAPRHSRADADSGLAGMGGSGAAGSGGSGGMAGSAGAPESLDRDGDGLANTFELAHGTDPDDADSDHDGVSDLAEIVANTDPLDPKKNPMANGDFYFVSPFMRPPEPERAPLLFATELQSADLFILLDTTGSMQGAITQLQSKLSTSIVPEVSKLVSDLQIGVGHFDDIPNDVYGNIANPALGLIGDDVLGVNQTVTPDPTLAQAGVASLALHSGGDGPEGAVPALYSLATGKGLGSYLADAAPCPDDGIGYACFRKGSVPIVLLISDAELHNGPNGENAYTGVSPAPATYQQAVGALSAVHAHVISVLVTGDGNLPVPPYDAPALQLAKLTTDTGAINDKGEPFIFTVDSNATQLDTRVIDAVQAVASQVPVEVSVVLRDDPSDSVDATQLIERIEPNTQGGIADPNDPKRVCVGGLATKDENGDGHDDAFSAVLPGTPICFDVIARMNTTVKSGKDPTLYKAFIDVVADHSSVLDTREVLFLVPPETPLLE